jgi:ABC-2 type transport system permease protein
MGSPSIALRSRPWDNVLAASWAIFIRDARIAMSYRAQFWLSWLGIAFSVGVSYLLGHLVAPSSAFGVGGKPANYFDYLVINIAFLRFQQTALQSFAQAIRDSQTAGTMEAILVTPTKLPVIVLSSGLWAFFNTALQTAVSLLLSLPFGLDLHRADLWAVLAFLALTIASIAPLGVIAAAAVIMFKQIGPFEFFITGLSNLFGGVYLPVALMPLPLSIIGWLLPITHALNGLRGAIQGASLQQLSGDAIWLVVGTVVLTPLSLMFFAMAVRRSQIDGTLGHY